MGRQNKPPHLQRAEKFGGNCNHLERDMEYLKPETALSGHSGVEGTFFGPK